MSVIHFIWYEKTICTIHFPFVTWQYDMLPGYRGFLFFKKK